MFGGSPSHVQRVLIERAARLTLYIEVMDREALASGSLIWAQQQAIFGVDQFAEALLARAWGEGCACREAAWSARHPRVAWEYAAGLAAERAKVEAERAKAERVVAEFAARDAQHAAELKTEQAQTEKAIAAFSALAERLDQLAAERARPWWRRLVG
jgi:hypothetical protein